VPIRPVSKLLGAAALAGVLVFSLAACSSSSTTATACAATKSGTASDSVKVSGKIGSKPTVKFTKGITAKATQRTVITAGKGTVASTGSTATVELTAYNGTTGKLIDSEGYTKASTPIQLPVDKSTVIPGLYKALHCAPAGSRVVTVVPPADAFGSAGSTDLGVKAKDNVVFVLDVAKVTLPVNAKVLDKPSSVFPKVTFDAKGVPTVAKPTGAAPKKLQIAYLKKGTGATVKSGDTVSVNYSGSVWSTGTVFQSTWSSTGSSPASFVTSQVVTGFSKALVGQKVGSEVIVIIPPADGYGSGGNSQIGVSGTDDIVFVVQILSTKAS
jgi:FKBP-type peptidyl-prolyl cis-trans isomerase